jgi:Fe2+ or Zn2+ uptake regulation protein
MTPLQQAVLRRIIEQGDKYKPFDADSLAAYSEISGQQVTVPDAQSALDSLRDKGLVIRMERGRYALDDSSLVEWLADRVSISTPNP